MAAKKKRYFRRTPKPVTRATKYELSTDEPYKAVVADFKRLRRGTGLEIQQATKTGGGRVFNFENLQYAPRLDTFLKWCRAAGIKVKLFSDTSAPSLKRVLKEMGKEDPGKIIDELKNELES